MIPTETFYADFLVKLEDVCPSDFQIETEDVCPANSQIEKYERILGINSIWVLPNLSSLLLFLCVYPSLLLILLILYIFSRYFKTCNRPMERLSSVVFWNWPIKQLNDNFIVIVISSLINIKYGSW